MFIAALPDSRVPHRRDAVQAALLAVLATPWLAHALVVGLSAAGARPLASRAAATAILFASVAGGVAAAGLSRSSLLPTPAVGPLAGRLRWLSWLLSSAGAVSLAASLLLAVLLPVVAYDALAYRLPVIAGWLDAGRVAWLVTDDPVRNGYPLGQEAVSSVIAAATGSMRFVTVASFFHVAAGALSIWLFAERAGVRRELARAGAALFLLVPMVILNAPTGYVDASFAGATVSAILLSALAFGSAGAELPVVAAAGMATAHALSLKGTGVAVVAAVGVAVAASGVVHALRKEPLFAQGALSRLLVATGFAAPGAFWLLRNVAHTGNPLWPVDVRVAGHEVFAGVASMESVLDVIHNTPAALAPLSEPARLLRTWFESSGFAIDFDDRLAGLGLAWPLLAAPAIVFTVTRLLRRDAALEQRTTLAIAITATAVAFVVQPMRWWPRYTIWVWGVGAVALALTAEQWLARGRSRSLAGALMAVLALGVVEGSVGLYHANGLATAVAHGGDLPFSRDPRLARNAVAWVDAAFWSSGVARSSDVCRGAWKPGTDDANLDGVLAQLSPRPRVHVVADDDADWSTVKRAWKDAGCNELLLFRGSPVLSVAQQDPEVTVETAVAFDPLYVVRSRRLSQLDVRNVTP